MSKGADVMARLGEAFVLIRNGASIKQTEGAGGIPITRIETISNREVDRNSVMLEFWIFKNTVTTFFKMKIF